MALTYLMKWYKAKIFYQHENFWSLTVGSLKHIVPWIIRGKIYGMETTISLLLAIDSQGKRVFRRPYSFNSWVLELALKWNTQVISRLFDIKRGSDSSKITNLCITKYLPNGWFSLHCFFPRCCGFELVIITTRSGLFSLNTELRCFTFIDSQGFRGPN